MNSDMYIESIMEHYKNPSNKGIIENPDASSRDFNPSCGDEIQIQIKFSNDIINEAKFDGHGCAISQSAVDLLIEMVKGRNADEVVRITNADFIKNLGVELSPLRLKCALLGMKVLKTAVYNYLGTK